MYWGQGGGDVPKAKDNNWEQTLRWWLKKKQKHLTSLIPNLSFLSHNLHHVTGTQPVQPFLPPWMTS